MLTINPKTEKISNVHNYLLGAVTPRPIAFASTIDNTGKLNLSPFSFFNAFSTNPPILIFSPARRVRENTIKHTLENVKQNKEVVISIVTTQMAQQVSLSSCDFRKGVSEFDKAGFTPVESDIVKPFCVKESPVNFECKVIEIIALGKEGGAGNLVLCKVLKIHIDKKILDATNNIDPLKLQPLSRLGGNWYGKVTEESLFQLKKPIGKIGIGIDMLAKDIQNSTVLSGSDLAILASVEEIPKKRNFEERENKNTEEKHILAKSYLNQNRLQEAWQLLL